MGTRSSFELARSLLYLGRIV